MATYTHLTLESPRVNQKLRRLEVKIHTEEIATHIAAGSISTQDIWDTSAVKEVTADVIVLVTQRRSNYQLYTSLDEDRGPLSAADISGLYAIGDCVSPSLIAETIFSGHRLAKEIDAPDPSRPLPFIRERRLLMATEDDFRLSVRN